MKKQGICDECGREFERPEPGAKPTLFDFLCPDCADLIARRLSWTHLGETINHELVVCPWCGYEHDDSEFWDIPPKSIRKCDQCKEPIEVMVHCHVTFTSRRPKSTMPPDFTLDPGDYEL